MLMPSIPQIKSPVHADGAFDLGENDVIPVLMRHATLQRALGGCVPCRATERQ